MKKGIAHLVLFLCCVFRLSLPEMHAASLHWEPAGLYSPGTAILTGVKYGGGVFVAWGDDIIVYTQDGVTWRRAENYALAEGFQELLNNSISNGIQAMAYGNGHFVAVSRGGYVRASNDGSHWNTQLLSKSAYFMDITFGDGLFVAVGLNGLIATSPDGLTWTMQSGTSKNLRMVAYGNGRFVASARAGDRSSDGFVISTDGVHWTEIPPAPLYTEIGCQSAGCKTATLLGGLVFYQGKFVLLAYTALAAGGFNSLLRSEDGITWATGEKTTAPVQEVEGTWSRNPVNSLTEANGILVPPNVAYANGLWIKVDYDLWRGADPYQMTKAPTLPGGINGMAGNGEIIVAVGGWNHLPAPIPPAPTPPISILISTNQGNTFELTSAPAGAAGLAVVRYADGKFVAVGYGGTIVTSRDGRSWTKVPSNTDANLYDLVYVGGTPNVAETRRPQPSPEGKWWAVGTRGRILTSSDAVSFTAQSIGDEFDLHSIAYGNGRFVVVSPHKGLFSSANGTEWIPVGTNLYGGAWGVAFGAGTFVTTGWAATSTDGVNWQLAGNGNVDGLRIAYADGFFVAPRLSDPVVEVSRDGRNWEATPVGPRGFLEGVDSVNGHLWISGGNGNTWRAVMNPQVTALVDAQGNLKFSIDVAKAGAYRVLTSPTALPGSWQRAQLLTVSAHAEWTNSPSASQAQFFQVREEYP